MHARLMSFGQLEIDGSHYDHDVIVEGGRVRRRKKRPSKALRDRYGHRLLVAEERSRGPQRLIMGTGASGRLPITPELRAEALRRGVGVVALPTRQACVVLGSADPHEVARSST